MPVCYAEDRVGIWSLYGVCKAIEKQPKCRLRVQNRQNALTPLFCLRCGVSLSSLFLACAIGKVGRMVHDNTKVVRTEPNQRSFIYFY